MIPNITIIVAAYVITRMIQLIVQKNLHTAVFFSAVITILLTVFFAGGTVIASIKTSIDVQPYMQR